MAVYARLNDKSEKDGVLYIKSPGSDYIWTVESPLLVQDTDNGYTWIGSSDIVPPPEGIFPAGRYSFVYTDAAGKKTETWFDIDTHESFGDIDLSEYTQKRLGIFSESGRLFGYRSERTDMSAEEVSEKYPGASFMRIILLSDDGLKVVMQEPVFISDNSSLMNKGGI